MPLSNAARLGRSYTCGMTIELRQLRFLLALAKHGSLGRAAVALGMTQPALTRALKILEQQTGSTLFERSKSGVAPTDQGRLLIQRAREVVEVADELIRDLVRSRVAGAGQVVLGAGPYPAETVVPAAMTTFVVENPLVRVRVLVRDWDELLRQLRRHEVDFFVSETSTLDGEPDLDVEALAPHPVYFVARRGHPLTRRASVRPADTFAYPFLALSRHPPRALEPMLATRREVDGQPARPFPAMELSSLAAVKRIVRDSDAIAPLTLTCVADEVRDGTLALLGTAPWLYVKYGFVALKGEPPSAAARALRDRLRDAEGALLREEALLVARYAARRKPARRKG